MLWHGKIRRELFWVTTGQVCSIVGYVFGIRLLTHLLSPMAYGELALAMTLVSFAQQIFVGPLSISLLRFFSATREQGDFSIFLKVVFDLLITQLKHLTVITIAVCCVLLWFGKTYWVSLCIVSVVFTFVSGFNSLYSAMQSGARNRVIVAWHDSLDGWLRFSMAWLVMRFMGVSSVNALLGFICASSMILVSQHLFFRRHIREWTSTDLPLRKNQNEREWRDKLWDYGRPFAIWAVFAWAYTASDRWALQLAGKSFDLGLYAALYQLSYVPMTMISMLMTQWIAPVVFDMAGDATDSRRLHKSIWSVFRAAALMLMVTMVAVIIAAIFRNPILQAFTGPSYWAVAGLMPWMVLAGGLFAVGQVLATTLLSANETRALIFPKVSTALLGVLLNFIGAKYWGIEGVVAAGVIFGVCYCVSVGVACVPSVRRARQPAMTG